MNKPKKHHYVPRSYLYFFSQNGKIRALENKTKKNYCVNINDVAEIRYYNKINQGKFIIDSPNGDPYYYEFKYNQLIEGEIPRIIGNIVSACTISPFEKSILTYEIKIELAKLIVVQLLRTPQFRQYVYEIGLPVFDNVIGRIRNQINSFTDFVKKEQLIGELEECKYNDAFVKSVHLSVTTDENRINQFCEFLVCNRSWCIFQNELYKDIPFVTSDTPVIMYNLQNGNVGPKNNAFENSSTIITMPLTPRYCITLYHKACVYGYYSKSYENKCTPIDERKFILKQNLHQIDQCSRQIYTSPDDKFFENIFNIEIDEDEKE